MIHVPFKSVIDCERFEPRSHFKSRLSLIVWVDVVLNRTVVIMSAEACFGWALFAGTQTNDKPIMDILATGVAVISSDQRYEKNFNLQYLQTLVVTFSAIPTGEKFFISWSSFFRFSIFDSLVSLKCCSSCRALSSSSLSLAISAFISWGLNAGTSVCFSGFAASVKN